MNLLFAYPVFMPVSNEFFDETSKLLLSMYIVLNSIWLFTFIFALIHNAIINANVDYKETLRDREYLFFVSLLCGAIDVIGLFFVICILISTLL
jgi:uncharacterized membrane protein